jgi:hypothetical protein
MNKKQIAKAIKEAEAFFNDAADRLIKQYEQIASSEENDGYQERYRRRLAIEELRSMQSSSLYVKGFEESGQNPLLIMLFTRFRENCAEWFGPNVYRIEDWYNRGWPAFLNDVYKNRLESDEGSRVVASWNLKEVSDFLSLRYAFRELEIHHDEHMQVLFQQEADARRASARDGTIVQSSGLSTVSHGVPEKKDSHQLDAAEAVSYNSETQLLMTDRVNVSLDRKVFALMLLRVMFVAGFSATDIKLKRLGRFIAYLQKDTSPQNENSNYQTVRNAMQAYRRAEKGDATEYLTDMGKLKAWLQHFTDDSLPSDSFIAQIEQEIIDYEKEK